MWSVNLSSHCSLLLSPSSSYSCFLRCGPTHTHFIMALGCVGFSIFRFFFSISSLKTAFTVDARVCFFFSGVVQPRGALCFISVVILAVCQYIFYPALSSLDLTADKTKMIIIRCFLSVNGSAFHQFLSIYWLWQGRKFIYTPVSAFA